MEIHSGHKNLNLASKTIATIGTFDGLHLGHQKIINTTLSKAHEQGLPSLLITFDLLPRQILFPKEPAQALTSLDQKLSSLERFGLDHVCLLKFKEIVGYSPRRFIEEILISKARIAHIFVGVNFRFGAKAGGGPDQLKEYNRDFDVTEVPLETVDDMVVSSTRIRNCLDTGDIEQITRLLGRNISLSGKVVHGAARGAGMGFPTANLELDANLCRPATGVYIGYLVVEGKKLPAVINCGSNPTFGDGGFHCEAHVLDYNGSLYGLEVSLELAARIRDEKTFPSPEALMRQITDDVCRAREWFSKAEK